MAKKIKSCLAVAIFALGFAMSAQAGTEYYMIGQDAFSKSSFSGARSASNIGWATSRSGSPVATAVMGGNNFVVQSGTRLRTGTATSETFGGATLTLEAGGELYLKSGETASSDGTVTIPSLIGAGGKLVQASSCRQTINGAVSVNAGSLLAIQLSAGRTLTVESTLTGDDTTTLNILVSQENSSGTQTLELKSAEGFLGAITGTKGSYGGEFILKLTGGFGGTITSLPANTTNVLVNIDDATTANGLRIATTTIPAPLKTAVVLYSDRKSGLSDGDAVMTFPAGTTVNPAEFTVKFKYTASGTPYTIKLNSATRTNGDGTISIVAHPDTYYKVGSDVNGTTTSFTGNQSATIGWSTNPSATSPDATVTMSGNDFIVSNNKMLRLPNGNDDAIAFAGKSLTLDGGEFALKSKNNNVTRSVTVNNLSVSSTSTIHCGNLGSTFVVKGANPITLAAGATLKLNLQPSPSNADKRFLVFDAPISGDDTTKIAIVGGDSSVASPLGVTLNSASGFFGTIDVETDSNNPKFSLELNGGFGGTITSLPANTTNVLVNIDDATTASGLRIATTTVPAPLKTAVVLYSDTKDVLTAGDIVMTFPAGTTVDPAEFTVKFQKTASGTPSALKLKRVENGDGTISLAVAGSSWTGAALNGDLSDAGNWSDGVPTGKDAYISVGSAATLTTGSGFAPASIVFGANSKAVTIDGSGEITSIDTVVSFSSVSHTINTPVRFTGNIQVKQAAMAEVDDLAKAHVTFAGGAYAAPGCALESGDYIATYSRCIFGRYYFATTSSSRWNAQYGGSGKRVCMADRSYLYIPYAGNLTVLYIGNGAKVDVGDIAADGGRIGYKNYGEMVVTNMTLTGSGNRYVSYQQGTETPGVFKFETVTNAMTGNWFYFSDSSKAASHVFYIGAGGLNFSGSGSAYAFGNFENNAETIRPWHSDFTIANRGDGTNTLILNRNVEFCTDDENGTGRTITIDGTTKGDGTSPAITVSGSGTLKVNKAANNVAQPPVIVTNTATLAIKPGASLGTGATTVNSGAALAVAESGTVALGGNLTLKDGATLKFNFTDRSTPPVLNLTGKTVTFGSGKDIKVSVAGAKRPAYGSSQGKYFLTSGGQFAGLTNEDVAKADDCASWVKSVGIENGDIYANIAPNGIVITVE